MTDTQSVTGAASFLTGISARDLIPLFSAIIVSLTAAIVAFFATWRLNKAMKQTEFFLKFTERFHNILLAKHQLEIKLDARSEPRSGQQAAQTAQTEAANDPGGPAADGQRTKEAHELYRQLFGLMFDEFFSYRRGFLDREVFVEWMRWRHFDRGVTANGPNFAIAGIPYQEGWEKYCENRPVQPQFREFVQSIHNIDAQCPELVPTINDAVLRYAGRAERISARICEYPLLLAFVAMVVLFVLWALLLG